MREALQEMAETDDFSDEFAGDPVDDSEELEKRVEVLEEEVRSLRQIVDEQEEGTRKLAQRVVKFEAAQREDKRTNSVEGLVFEPKANAPSGTEQSANGTRSCYFGAAGEMRHRPWAPRLRWWMSGECSGLGRTFPRAE